MEFCTAPSAAPVAIALVDASYSVKDSFVRTTSIFTKFCDILKSLPHKHFYLQFWSSPGALGSPSGTLKFPFKVEKSQLSQPFGVCATKEFRSTFPHLGFVGIDDWLKAGIHTVYLLTDGAMSNPSSSELKDSVSEMMTKYPDVQLHLITVEARDVQLQNLEDMQGLVGGDVYHILVKNHMTHLLSGFVSYTRNYLNGYTHLSRVRAPAGYLSFRDGLFREVDLPKFFVEAQRLVSELDPQDEEKLLQLLQDLVTPVARAQRDKPASMVQAMTRNFASLFAGTCINPQIAVFLLSSGCTSDNAGQVQVLADFRRQLRDVFKSAHAMLCAGVANAIGLSQQCDNKWMSLPMACRAVADKSDSKKLTQVIVVGPAHVLDKEVTLQGSAFQQGVVQLGDTLVGALPMITGELPSDTSDTSGGIVTGGLTEQCTRQWVRALVAQTYGVNATADIVVYLIMALHAQVKASPAVSEDVKQAWANLAKIMLRKKRANSTETEWDRLERGEFPLPNNGSLDSLCVDLLLVLHLLGVNSDNDTTTETAVPSETKVPTWRRTWRALCEPLGLVSQLRHCDEPETSQQGSATDIVWPKIGSVYTLPMEDLEYKCGITMESTALTGGFKLQPHASRTAYQCSPRLVFSDEGMRALLDASAPKVCPICYVNIDRDSFVAVAPACTSERELPTFASNPLLVRAPSVSSQSQVLLSHSAVPSNTLCRPTSQHKPRPATIATCTDATKGLVFLKGTLGCGKTTFAETIKASLMSAGTQTSVCILNADRPDAEVMADALAAVRAGTNYIIVDTCYFKSFSSFGIDVGTVPCCTMAVNYDKKNEDLEGLLAWSWRNVEQRSSGSSSAPLRVGASAGAAWADFDRKARVAYGKGRVRKALTQLLRQGEAGCAALADKYAQKIDGISAQQLACVLARFKVAQ
jgi:hypothetical protein